MDLARARQILAYRRAQEFIAHPKDQEPGPPDPKNQSEVLLVETVPAVAALASVAAAVAEPCSTAALENQIWSPPAAVDPHWLQTKLRQLSLPALQVLLVQLPPALQRLLLLQLDKSMAVQLLKKSKPQQQRQLLRGWREEESAPDYGTLALHYQQLFTAAMPQLGKERLAEICRYLSPQQLRRIAQPAVLSQSSDLADLSSLRRMVREFSPKERALLLGQPRLGRAVVGMLSLQEKLACLAELIPLVELPLNQRRRRLRQLLLQRGEAGLSAVRPGRAAAEV